MTVFDEDAIRRERVLEHPCRPRDLNTATARRVERPPLKRW